MNRTVHIDIDDDLGLVLSTEGIGDMRIQLTMETAMSLLDKLLATAERRNNKTPKAPTN